MAKPSLKDALPALLLSCSLIPLTAAAAGLGDIHVTSLLGERFRAEIPLLNSTSAIVPGCFQLTTDSPDAIDELPWLNDVQIALLSAPPRLLISSRRQVADPVVQLAVHTGCGVFLTRHYTALLSPREASNRPPVAGERPAVGRATSPRPILEKSGGETSRSESGVAWRTAQAGETAVEMARRLYPRSRSAQKRFVRKMVALNPERLVSESGDEPLPEGVDLNYPAPVQPEPVLPRRQTPSVAAVAPPATKAGGGDRLMLMPSDEPLPAAQALPPATSEEIGNRLNDVEGQVRAMHGRLNALRVDYPTPPPAIQTVLVEIETRLLALELTVARIKLGELETVPKAVTPATAEEPAAKVVDAKASSVPIIPAASASSPIEPPAGAIPSPTLGAALAVLGLFGFGLVAFLYRRAPRVRDTLVPTVGERARTHAFTQRPEVVEAPQRPLVDAAPVVVVPEAASTPVPDKMQEEIDTPKESQVFEDPAEVEQPIELADLMLIYGRLEGAIEVLTTFIETKPKESLLPSLRLLEIYQQANMHREFEQVAEQLSRRFNIERVRWDVKLSHPTAGPDEPSDLSQPPCSIGDVPEHVHARIVANWGTTECLDFLRSLLSESRNGTREGFSVSVIHEILGLIRALENKLLVEAK